MKINYKLLMLLFGIAAIILLIAFNRPDRSKSNYVIKHKNFIFNTIGAGKMDTIIHAGLESMDIENVSIRIEPMTQPLFIGEVMIDAYIIGNDHQYIISISKMNSSNYLDVLSHELVHLKQYNSKRLYYGTDYIVFDDIVYNRYNMPPYSDRVWEIEAMLQSNDLKRKIRLLLNQ